MSVLYFIRGFKLECDAFRLRFRILMKGKGLGKQRKVRIKQIMMLKVAYHVTIVCKEYFA